MRKRLSSFAITALFAVTGAMADGFVPMGGFTATSHYAIETSASGFKATSAAVLSHGSVPSAATYTSGISQIRADREEATAILSADCRQLLVEGMADGTACLIYSIDGRLALPTSVTDGAVDISHLSAGHYIVSLHCGDMPRIVTHILKSR